MPLYNNDAPVLAVPPAPPTVTPTPLINTASMYTAMQYNGGLIAYLDGSPWTCTYYAQYLGADDVIINSNDVDDPTLKQYLKINTFELRVTSALAPSVNTGTSTSTVTGTSNVYPVITPVVGDVFIALIEAGVYGIFEITSFERLSQFQNSAWSITYHQIGYSNPNAVAALDSFVVGELFFDVTLLDTGSNPLRTESENLRVATKDKLLADIIDGYYAEFYDNVSGTFLLPIVDGKDNRYDPYLVAFWNTYIKQELYSGREQPIEYDTKNSLCANPFTTVFDALGQQSAAQLKYCVKAMREVSSTSFDASFQRHTLRISPIELVIFPYLTNRKADLTYGDTNQYPPYIFSANFYAGSTGQSNLETQITKVLNKEAVLFADILNLTNTIDSLAPIDRFYQVPFMLVLLLLAR